MVETPTRQRSATSGAMEPDTTLPAAGTSGVEPRVVDAWCEWLGALAKDAEAALAAAMAYKELDAASRDQWLGALEQDAARVSVPRIAVYAPLLAVESDPARRARITEAIGPADSAATPRVAARGLCGLAPDGSRVAAVVTPLYLDFVQVLACGFAPTRGFDWVRHDPIVDRRRAPNAGEEIAGVALENTPLRALIDELAQAVLSHQRSGRELPEALRVFADLFGPGVGEPPADPR
jgi:hypothetical protein